MSPEPCSLRAVFPCGPDLADAAAACEAAVFGRVYGDTPEELAGMFAGAEARTSLGCVAAVEPAAVLGAVRLLRPDPADPGPTAGLTTLQAVAAPPWDLPLPEVLAAAGLDPQRSWDVLTFAVDAPRCREVGVPAQLVCQALFGVLFGALRDNGVPTFVAVLDALATRVFRGLGVVFHELPGATARPFLGSPASVPMHQDVAALHDAHAASHPALHDAVFHARGVPGLPTPEPGRFALPRVAGS